MKSSCVQDAMKAAHHGDGYFQKLWSHEFQQERRSSPGPQAASQKRKGWQQEVQELLWLPGDEALPLILWQMEGRIKVIFSMLIDASIS